MRSSRALTTFAILLALFPVIHVNGESVRQPHREQRLPCIDALETDVVLAPGRIALHVQRTEKQRALDAEVLLRKLFQLKEFNDQQRRRLNAERQWEMPSEAPKSVEDRNLEMKRLNVELRRQSDQLKHEIQLRQEFLEKLQVPDLKAPPRAIEYIRTVYKGTV